MFQFNVSWLTPAVAVRPVGVSGTVVAVTDDEALDAADVP